MTTFREFLAEEMKDPEFKEGYERVSAEEEAKLKATLVDAVVEAAEEVYSGRVHLYTQPNTLHRRISKLGRTLKALKGQH